MGVTSRKSLCLGRKDDKKINETSDVGPWCLACLKGEDVSTPSDHFMLSPAPARALRYRRDHFPGGRETALPPGI